MTGIADDAGAVLTTSGVSIGGDEVGLSVGGGSKATVTGSSITGDSIGIWDANAGTATVTRSAITGDGTGILVGNGGGDISTLTAQQDSFAGDAMGLQDIQDPTIYTLSPDVATDDWWGSLTGPTNASNPGGTGVPVAGNVNFTPWIGVYTNGTPTGQPGFSPTVSAYYAVPTQLVFTTEPSSSAIEGQALASQPVVKAEDASGNLGINFNGTVALALKAHLRLGHAGRHELADGQQRRRQLQRAVHQRAGHVHADGLGDRRPWTGLTAVTSSPATTVADGALTDTTSAQSYSVTLGNSLGSNPVTLTTFTDANPHATASDYNVTVNWGGSATSTSDSVQFVSSSATSSTWKVVGNATYGAAGTYTVSVTVTDVDLGAHTFTDTHTTVNVTAGTSSATATFLKQDATTQGTWIGTYGAQGYDVIDGSASLPSYATVTPSGQTSYTWASSTTDVRALQTAGGASRIAASWYRHAASRWTSTSPTGRRTTWSCTSSTGTPAGRAEQVQISDAATGAVLSTQSISSFQTGVYLDYAVSGNIADHDHEDGRAPAPSSAACSSTRRPRAERRRPRS